MTVTVVVPTRNSARTLTACLRSVREQTHEPIELVIVDNNSSDATELIAHEHADRVLLAGPERSAQRNLGAREARGSYLFFVDSDMVLEPTVVAECVEAASAGADAVVVPERSFGSGYWARCKTLERSCYVGDSTIEAARFFSRAAFERAGGYDESLSAGEDWDLHERACRGGASIGRTAAYIEHDEGALRLHNLLAKKFRYGTTFHEYLAKHPSLARNQVRLLRPAFIRHRRELARRPMTTLGMFVMKAAEAGAGAAGLIAGRMFGVGRG
jgi:GT2 family glycosyltransferase